jgi:hypothetical protein
MLHPGPASPCICVTTGEQLTITETPVLLPKKEVTNTTKKKAVINPLTKLSFLLWQRGGCGHRKSFLTHHDPSTVIIIVFE